MKANNMALRLFIHAAIVALMTASLGCASGPKQKQKDLKKAPEANKSPDIEPPTSEQMANHPCGNPDWAQLPAGAQHKTDPDNTGQDNADQHGADPNNADTTKSEQSKANRPDAHRAALYPDTTPCT